MTNLVKKSGQVFTPDYLVNLILDEAGYVGTNILQKHCIDNSCGDGAFLCEITKRYVEAYKSAKGTLDGVEYELKQYIHGVELESVAYSCCCENISMLLTSMDLPNASIDILHGNTLKVHRFDGKMDFVIGNPPYVRVHNLDDNFDDVKSFNFANGGMTDIYLVFFELGFRMLKKNGKLCYITPSSWLNSVAGLNMRNYILMNKNLLSVIDLGHFQAFSATTYTLISLFQKGACNDSFTFNNFNPESLGKTYVCEVPFNCVSINGYFYLASEEKLKELSKLLTYKSSSYVSVKNGFATLADKIFIKKEFPFDKYVIPVIKASTGKWYKAFYPYDENGKPFSKDEIFANKNIANYLNSNKVDLLKKKTEEQNPFWYLFGRTQALKDVHTNKISINTTIKDVNSIKINKVPSGSGLYSGLYILTNASYETIVDILCTDDFIAYIASLKKYKSGGYYTFNSKDLEQYLNFKISNLIERNGISIKPINKSRIPEGYLSIF